MARLDAKSASHRRGARVRFANLREGGTLWGADLLWESLGRH